MHSYMQKHDILHSATHKLVPLSDPVFFKVYIETKKNPQRTWPDHIEIFFMDFLIFLIFSSQHDFFKKRKS